MSDSPAARRTSPASNARALALLALLVAEGLYLGVRFDSAALERFGAGWWTPVVDVAGRSMSAAAVVLAALALFAVARARAAGEPEPWRLPHRWVPFVAAELAGFAGLVALGEGLFDPRRALAAPGAWIAGALASSAWTLAAWLAALVPPRALLELARRHAAGLGATILVGASAFAAGLAAQDLWRPLRAVTLAAAKALLGVVEGDVVVDERELVLGVGDFAVRIAPACSGYEGIGLALAFAALSLFLFRDAWRFPRAWLLLPLAALVAWVANVVRLAALVSIGAHVSRELALGGFHSYAGTVLFCAAALGTVGLALRSPWFARAAARTGPNPAAPYLVPFLVAIAAALVSRAFASGAREPLFALRSLAALFALAGYAGTYRRWSWRPSALALGAGAAVACAWWILARGGEPAPRPAGVEIALRAAHAVLIVPLVEELAFRGFLARRVTTREFEALAPQRISWLAIAISSIAFGLLHQTAIAGVLAGVAYALVYRRRGSLSDAVWAHATTNALLVALALATGEWALWT